MVDYGLVYIFLVILLGMLVVLFLFCELVMQECHGGYRTIHLVMLDGTVFLLLVIWWFYWDSELCYFFLVRQVIISEEFERVIMDFHLLVIGWVDCFTIVSVQLLPF